AIFRQEAFTQHQCWRQSWRCPRGATEERVLRETQPLRRACQCARLLQPTGDGASQAVRGLPTLKRYKLVTLSLLAALQLVVCKQQPIQWAVAASDPRSV